MAADEHTDDEHTDDERADDERADDERADDERADEEYSEEHADDGLEARVALAGSPTPLYFYPLDLFRSR